MKSPDEIITDMNGILSDALAKMGKTQNFADTVFFPFPVYAMIAFLRYHTGRRCARDRRRRSQAHRVRSHRR